MDYAQQIHWTFKHLIENVNWKVWFIFIIKNIDGNVIFSFNFDKIFFWYRKFNFAVIEIIKKLFIFLCNSFWIFFFLILISPFLDFLTQQVILHKKFQLMIYKLKYSCIETWLNQESDRNFHLSSYQFCITFIEKIKFMIYHYFCYWIEINSCENWISVPLYFLTHFLVLFDTSPKR